MQLIFGGESGWVQGDMALKHEREQERETEVLQWDIFHEHFRDTKTIKANCTRHTLKMLDQLMHQYKILNHQHVY
jgi:hypothetical protein